MTLGRIGAYRITGELGRGGLGTVYRAIDPSGQLVAVKVLLSDENADAATRLLQESSLRIEHPNVVRTLGGGLGPDARPYLVLELLEGQPLRHALPGAEARSVVEWVRQAALGVAAIHAFGLVHRDIKPENLFLCRDGTVKVLDLGIAAWRDSRVRLTATGAVVGTPAYLAPEQARGMRALDPRIDVWALGAVLYEGLTGQALFRRDSMLATLLAVSIDPIPSVDELVPDASAELAAVVARCLERSVDKRLGSASALADALGRILDLSPTTDHRPSRASAMAHERSVALLLLRLPPGAEEEARFSSLVREADGEPVPLADGRAIAVFGARVSRGDEAARALKVARALEPIDSPIAIALGRGAIGLVGQAASPRGEVVREADEALARAPSGIVCGPRAAKALKASTHLEEIAPGLFRLGEATLHTTTITPLLARDAELAMLRRAQETAELEARVVTTWILGAPGAGKTRLAEAVRSIAASTEPPMILREAHARDAASGALSMWHRALSIEATGAASGADATVLVDRARQAVIDALEEAAARGPLTVVLEDAQWADPLSLSLITEIGQQIRGRAVWLVVTGRPELLDRLAEPPDRSAVIEPAPLTARDAIAMAWARGKRPRLEVSVAQALVNHTGGNPLFLELILDATDQLPEAGASWDAALPPTVEYAVQARLDHLPPGERAALTALALLGRPADGGELGELGLIDVEDACESLSGRDLVVRGSSPEGRTYRVRSPLIAKVAAGVPSVVERRAMHRRAAEVAERRGRDEEEIAQHREAAGDPERAASFYLSAALGAVNGGDARKVLRCAERALACGVPTEDAFALHAARADAARWVGDPSAQDAALSAAESAAVTDAERALVASDRGEWLRRSGDLPGALAQLERAVALARASGDPDMQVRAACRQSIALVMLGQAERAAALLASVAPSREKLSTASLGLLEESLGFVAGSVGDLGTRRAAFARAADLHAAAGDLRRAAGAESNAADASNRLGDYAGAQSALRRAIERARRVGNRLTEGYALANLGYALTGLGRAAEAREVLGEALTLARRIGDRHLEGAAQLYLGRADPGGAPEPLHALADDPAQPPVIRAGALALLGRRALAAGASKEAAAHAHAALALIEGADLEEGEGEVWLMARDALTAIGDTERASAVTARARGRLEQLAARISDPEARRSFLHEVPEHRQLLA